MRLTALAIVGFLRWATQASAETCTETAGNWYCSQVEAVTYENFGGTGTYQLVTNMDSTTGTCTFKNHTYTNLGGAAPFDEELSLHLAGPLWIKQFAFYIPSTSSKSKRSTHRHKHGKVEKQPHSHHELEKRVVSVERDTAGSIATAAPVCPQANGSTYTMSSATFIIDCHMNRTGVDLGLVYTESFLACVANCSATEGCLDISWAHGSPGACYLKSSIGEPVSVHGVWGARVLGNSSLIPAAEAVSNSAGAKKTATSSSTKKTTKSSSTMKTTTSTTAKSTSTTKKSTKVGSTTKTATAVSATSSVSGTTWTQQAYYDSLTGSSSGLTFLNVCGGEVSGVWDSAFGSSLSYATTDGCNAAASPQVLANTTLPSTAQVVIMSDTSCADGLCGYYRPGSVAYHGFSGANKIFLIEFAMPQSSSGTNMPAVWFLNSLIDRTQQYGSCSCWANTGGGCGEFDVFEVLDAGDNRMTSAIHGAQANGDSDYFMRPTSGTMKVAIVFDGAGAQATIKVLDSGFVFGSELTGTDFALLAAVEDAYVAGNVSTVSLS